MRRADDFAQSEFFQLAAEWSADLFEMEKDEWLDSYPGFLNWRLSQYGKPNGTALAVRDYSEGLRRLDEIEEHRADRAAEQEAERLQQLEPEPPARVDFPPDIPEPSPLDFFEGSLDDWLAACGEDYRRPFDELLLLGSSSAPRACRLFTERVQLELEEARKSGEVERRRWKLRNLRKEFMSRLRVSLDAARDYK